MSERKDLSGMDYAGAGVSIIAQNEVNNAIKKKLKELGLDSAGLFGGAVDISHLKGEDSIPIGVVCSSMQEDESLFNAGKKTANAALDNVREGVPIALLDYFASEGMDVNEVPEFVEGVAIAGLERGVPLIGGESAQMPGTYNKGKRDAYVHAIFHGDQGRTVEIADLIQDMKRPLLCASTDGTGTKTRIVKDPRDIIHHGSNDLGAIGVRPIAFALYVAGNTPRNVLEQVVLDSKIICDQLGLVALDHTVTTKKEDYVEGQVDIAGTVIGVIDEKNMITGEGVQVGDVILGVAADCLMTNGYSLARGYCKFNAHFWNVEGVPGLKGTTIGEELSKPHIPYTDILFGTDDVEGVLSKFEDAIKATAHITGGGQRDNIKRMVPKCMCAMVEREVLPLPPIVEYFRVNCADIEAMYEAFNMGVGFTLTVGADIAHIVRDYISRTFTDSIPGIERTVRPIGVITSSVKGEKFKFV